MSFERRKNLFGGKPPLLPSIISQDKELARIMIDERNEDVEAKREVPVLVHPEVDVQ